MLPYFPVLILFIQYLFFYPLPIRDNGVGLPGHEYPFEEVVTISNDRNEEGYSIFYPKDQDLETAPVVLFIHGYGAINPMIFGAWIEHLALNGNIVIYPRYQRNLIYPSSTRFTPLVASAYKNAIEDLRSKGAAMNENELIVIGHSYGGVIAANIGVQFDTLQMPQPSAIFSCEPGHGPLTGGVLQNYSSMPEEIPLVVMVGDKDWTVGDAFGQRLYNELSPEHPKLMLRQVEANYDSLFISASHYEPYAIDPDFDNGNRNLTFKRAVKKGKLNAVDYYGYWKVLDKLINCRDSSKGHCLKDLTEEWELGVWPDTNIPVKAIQVEKYSESLLQP